MRLPPDPRAPAPQMRKTLDIEGDPWQDLMLTTLCPQLALWTPSEEAREQGAVGRGSVSSAKTHSSARTASQGAVDGGASGSGSGATSDADGFHPLGTPTVTLRSHVVDDLPPPHSASVTRYTPAFYANMTGPTDTNATVPLTYSTVRVNTTIGATGHGVSLFHCSSAF